MSLEISVISYQFRQKSTVVGASNIINLLRYEDVISIQFREKPQKTSSFLSPFAVTIKDDEIISSVRLSN